MSDRDDALASVAGIIKDYRTGEIPEPTLAHVDRWVRQFDAPVQLPMLQEVAHVLKRTYFSKANVTGFFGRQIEHRKLAGEVPCAFWRSANLLNIQRQGHSQAEIRALFGMALQEKCKLGVEECNSAGGPFIYLDDVLFSGNRIGTDLLAWIADSAPATAKVHILVIATHQLGEWQCIERLKKAAIAAGKTIEFHCLAAARFENRKARRDISEVLWPTALPDDPVLQAYVAAEQKFPFEPRQPGGKLDHAIFSSEEGRQLLERELLLAGMRIRSFSKNPNAILRPLGFSAFGLGFGSMIATFRNCPNNAPLALWWGDPNAAMGHPFRNWYPLLPRKTYPKEVGFDDIGA